MFAVTNNTEQQRYEMVVDNWTAYVTYAENGQRITLIHTLVPTALEGQSVGSTLIRSVLDDARRRRLKVIPECAFVAGFMKRHPSSHDLLSASAGSIVVSAVPSMPFPETPDRRAAISRDIGLATGLDDVLLERLVRTFYAAAREDVLLGALFAGVHDWEAHIAKITTFWSSVALMTGRYHGQPLAAHFPLELRPQHFARWLALFEQTATETCSPQAVGYLMEKARRIAQSLEFGGAVHRGELPVRPTAAARMQEGSVS